MTRTPLLILTVFLAFGSTSCNSGGGSGGSSGGGSGVSSSTTGRVALVVGDMPVDDIDSLEVTITKAVLKSDDGDHLLFEGSVRVDLLDFQDQEFLLALKDDVPARDYSKIRLWVSDPAIAPNPDGYPVVIPGNGKLDLNPRETIQIDPGDALTIRLDFDVARSVHVVLTGSGRYIVRPVIFIDVERGEAPVPLTDFAGEIVEIDLSAGFFRVDVDSDAGVVRVDVLADTVIYDESVDDPVGLSALTVGDRVLVRGDLLAGGTIAGLVVFEGDPLRLRGEVPDGTAFSPFPFTSDLGQPLDGTFDTTFATEARFFVEDGMEVAPDPLGAGTRARTTGRYFASEDLYRVGLVDLEVTVISGVVVSTTPAGTPPLMVVNDAGVLRTVAFQDSTVTRLIGDEAVPLEFLAAGLEVEVSLSGVLAGYPLAQVVRIEPLAFQGTVVAVDAAAREVVIEPSVGGPLMTLRIRDEAEILVIQAGVSMAIPLGDVPLGSEIEAFGLLDPDDAAPTIWGLIIDQM